MGHAMNYLVVPHKEDIMTAAQEFSEINADRGENPYESYHGNLTIHTNTVYESEEDAEDAIKRYDTGFYSDHAVRFHNTRKLKPSKELLTLNERLGVLQKKTSELIKSSSVLGRKTKTVLCKNCESTISVGYLTGDNCPVCRHDLRSAATLQRITSMRNKESALFDRIRTERNKSYAEAPIEWLVKVEVHC